MPNRLPAAARPRRPLLVVAFLAWTVIACSPAPASPTPRPSSAQSSSTTAPSSPTATPTPAPAPVFTNRADPELAALIPEQVGAVAISIPPVAEFSVTPGDIGEVYGEIGLRFVALQVAWVERPRLSLYAMRMRSPQATTAELEPYLAAAGQYVGIAGLHREPWKLVEVADRLVWARPEDDATVAGTMVYTWAADEYVFLLIGVDDALNGALIGELPGEPVPTPTPRPSRSPAPSSSEEASESAAPS
jgi:hypothetical protein